MACVLSVTAVATAATTRASSRAPAARVAPAGPARVRTQSLRSRATGRSVLHVARAEKDDKDVSLAPPPLPRVAA